MERLYFIDWVRVLCKGSKALIYFLALVWLVWFTRTAQMRVRRPGVLLFIGLPSALAGISLALLGPGFTTGGPFCRSGVGTE